MNTSITIVLRLSIIVLVCTLLSGCNFGLGSDRSHEASRENIIIEEISRTEDKQTDGQTEVVTLHTERIQANVTHNELKFSLEITVYNDYLTEQTAAYVRNSFSDPNNIKHIKALGPMYEIAAEEIEELARFPFKP